MDNEVVTAFEAWLDNPRVLSPATPYLAKKQAFWAGYKAANSEVYDLKILLDANKEMADKYRDYITNQTMKLKKVAVRLNLALLLLNEAGPIMEKHYLRKRWFESLNELNKVEAENCKWHDDRPANSCECPE